MAFVLAAKAVTLALPFAYKYAVDAMATMYLYHEPAEGRRMTYPPAPDAVPPSLGGDSTAAHHH